ncbi:MAG: non-hydrolyzing UDP-N-acetylglucosamine 2-epimerase [Bryobacteraceae bacterium]
MKKILVIFGTRPEAIKLSPVILHLRRSGSFQVDTCATGQHRQMLDQVLEVFGIVPDHDLNIMRPDQSPAEAASRMLAALDPVLERERPDMILVQGDTTTTLCGALAAFYRRIPVGHVEAGLRTGDLRQPFPEEMNRVVTGRLAALHFAATEGAAQNLRREGVPTAAIHVTGNTGIDAVLHVKAGLESGALAGRGLPPIDPAARLIVATTHRRESFGGGLDRICHALAALASREDVRIVLPVHPNPKVRGPVERWLGDSPRVRLVAPMDYVSFVDLMRRAHLIVTDSGGIQEEAPSLGKPVLVVREKTERPEAVLAGTVKLVGTDFDRIVDEATLLLDSGDEYRRMAAIHNPYGDGQASPRIARAMAEFLETNEEMGHR